MSTTIQRLPVQLVKRVHPDDAGVDACEIPPGIHVRRLPGKVVPLLQNAEYVEGVVVDASGQIHYDQLASAFEAHGTSITMANADAIKTVAWLHRAALQSYLGMPKYQHLQGPLGIMVFFWNQYKLRLRQAHETQPVAVGQDTGRSQDMMATSADAHADTDAGRQPASSARPSKRTADSFIRELKSTSFDGIVAAVQHFSQHHKDYKVRSQGKPLDVVIAEVLALLQLVVSSEWTSYSEGAGSPEHTSSVQSPSPLVLLKEWEAAHAIRVERNELDAHPFSNPLIAGSVASLYNKAVSQHHPALQRVQHIAALAARAVEEQIVRDQARALQSIQIDDFEVDMD